MANAMDVTVFETPVNIRMGLPQTSGHLTASIVGQGNAVWTDVFVYDPVSNILSMDREKLYSIMKRYRSKGGTLLTFLIFLSDFVINIVNFFTGLIRAFASGFVGFGLMGIFLVFVIWMFALAFSLLAFIYIIPLILLSYGLKTWRNRVFDAEIEKLKTAALDLFNGRRTSPEALGPALLS